METQLVELFEGEPRQLCPDTEISVVLIDKHPKFTRFAFHVGNQRSVAYNAIASPCKKIFPYLKKILHPVLTGFKVFRREALRGGFRRERAVHLTKRWKIFSTTDPYFERFSRLVSFGDALWLHNEMDFEKGMASPQFFVSLGT